MWAIIACAWAAATTAGLWALARTLQPRYLAHLYISELLRWLAIATAAAAILALGRT